MSACGVVNDFQSSKSIPGNHGQFYIEPEAGAIIRLIVPADLRPEDPVKQQDTRIDSGPVRVRGVSYLAPVEWTAFSAVSLSGGSNRRMSVRRSLESRKVHGLLAHKIDRSKQALKFFLRVFDLSARELRLPDECIVDVASAPAQDRPASTEFHKPSRNPRCRR